MREALDYIRSEHTIQQQAGDTLLRRGDVWAYQEYEQEITSAATSINAAKLPAVFNTVDFAPGTRNADIGGGRFDDATEAMAAKGVENVIFDPFNRTKEHNDAAIARIRDGQADTATVSNVLNVIREQAARDTVIRQAANAIKDDGVAYFTIYEGDASSHGEVTRAGWQNNRKADEYISEIKEHFGDVRRKGNMLEARQPKRDVDARMDPETLYRLTRGDSMGAQSPPQPPPLLPVAPRAASRASCTWWV